MSKSESEVQEISVDMTYLMIFKNKRLEIKPIIVQNAKRVFKQCKDETNTLLLFIMVKYHCDANKDL